MNKAIHGAFRRDLDRFITALGTFQPGDRTRAAQLATAWANFDDQLTHHHEGEHEIAWPALAAVGVSPELLAGHGRRARHHGRRAQPRRARRWPRSLRDPGADQVRSALAAFESCGR